MCQAINKVCIKTNIRCVVHLCLSALLHILCLFVSFNREERESEQDKQHIFFFLTRQLREYSRRDLNPQPSGRVPDALPVAPLERLLNSLLIHYDNTPQLILFAKRGTMVTLSLLSRVAQVKNKIFFSLSVD